MTDQPGPSPWNNHVGPTPDPGLDAPTTSTSAVGPGAAAISPPTSDKSNRLKAIVAINAAIILIGAAVIAVLLLKGGDDGSDVALLDDQTSTTAAMASTDAGRTESDRSTTSSATQPGQDEDNPVELAPKAADTANAQGGTKQATATAGAPAPNQPPVTLPPSTEPAAPPVPGPDDAIDQVRTTLTEFMAADSRDDVDAAMSYLAPPVEQWVVPDNRQFDAAQLRADLSDPGSSFELSLIDDPTLAYGPEATPDGGWMVKVNYTMNADGEYLSQSGEWKCVNNDQRFLDTLVAPSGGTPRISSHEQVGEPVKFC